MVDAIDIEFLKQAIAVSENAPKSKTCYSVGAVLVSKNRQFIADGYTLEFGEGWHAEASAVKKAYDAKIDIKGSTIYSSMEPCSVRTSGKEDCSSLLIKEGISRVVFALAEPPVFVKCEGENKLKTSGIVVEHIKEFDEAVINVNKHLLLT